MALFELEQDFGSDPETEWKAPTFKDCAAADIDLTFFEQDEHADLHTVDGKEALVIVDDQRLKEHNSHWEKVKHLLRTNFHLLFCLILT